MCGTFGVCVWARSHCRHRRAVLMRHFDFDADTRCSRGKGGGYYNVVPGIHRRPFRVFGTALKLAPPKRALLLKRAGQNEPMTTRAECCAKQRARSYERAAQPSTVPPEATYKASHAYTNTGPRNLFSERAVQTPLPRGRFAGYYGKPKCRATHRRPLYRLRPKIGIR